MNISQIKASPCCERRHSKDFPVFIKDVLGLPGVRNWIQNIQTGWPPDQLVERLKKEESAYVRVRFTKDGTILSMDLSQYGAGCLGVFSYADRWDELIRLIERDA